MSSTRRWDLETQAPAKSGQLFHVDCSVDDARKMHAMLEIQWALIRIAAMSGTADAVDHGFELSSEPNWIVLSWLADQADF